MPTTPGTPQKPVQPVRSALYLDFDNVFSALMKLDPRLALRYAEDPASWVSKLTTELLTTVRADGWCCAAT